MLNKLIVLYYALYGYLIKWMYDLHLLSVPALGSRSTCDAIVSLTSYGRRVNTGVVCYSIYSILRQTLHPKRIILWLAEMEWNDGNLPAQVSQLRKYGVEIRYHADMRSFKKLLPALALFPDDTIVTVDDDVIYPKQLLEQLWQTHKDYPSDIIGTRVLASQEKLPYIKWQDAPKGTASLTYFAVGIGSILYPPHCIPTSLMDYTLAQQYAPLADDVWFWGASMVTHTQKRKMQWAFRTISFDALYQYFHKGSALQHSNVKGKGEITNDNQIQAVLQYLRNEHKLPSI